jgi:group I intron endonuclease
MKPYGIIYKATNIITGQCYIGQTIKPLQRRIQLHQTGKYRSYFQNSLKKYGIENFKWEILKENVERKMLGIMETFMIMVHNTHVSDGGFNLTWGGEGISGYKHSKESIQKGIETKRRNNTLKPSKEAIQKRVETRRKNGTYKPSKEAIQKRVETRRKNGTYKVTKEAIQKGIETRRKNGKKDSPETREKKRKRMTGSGNPMYGKVVSIETRQKISNSLKGRVPWNKKGDGKK